MSDIPGYTNLRPLGQGGMATVYLALQQSLGREVALKILSPALAQDATATERFLREARLAANLHHPNIVPIHDVGIHDGTPYMAMEYVPGGNVAPAAVAANDPDAVLRTVRDIAGALDHAHRQGVIHRDIKPENILRQLSGSCVLSDFGIARTIESTTALTQEGDTVGTPHYMSPEHLRGQQVDGRSDLYSLGVVLYQLLTGRLPYSGTDNWAIGTQHISEPIPRMPGPLERLQPLVDGLMAKEPAARPQTGADVVRQIDVLLAGATATPTIGLPAAESTSRRRTPWLIGAAIALVVVGSFALSRYWRPHAEVVAVPMMVRLAGFEVLSADLPATTPVTVDAEIAAAFNADGVVGVSSATAPAPGSAPAYALSGTIQRDGQTIRVITRLTNERSGATLWSGKFNYDGSEGAKFARHVAVDAGNVVRCGLFGASTYYKPLPDSVLRDYMQFCQGYWDPHPREWHKALLPAQRVVAAVPDFSWGWAAVAGAFWKVGVTAETTRSVDEARASGRQAADRAIAIDDRNSEALYIKSLLVDWRDWLARETLLKRAVGVRRLDCGCEHTSYGWMLANVGRTADALEQLRRANDMLALDVYTHLTLAEVLVAAGKPEEAKAHYDAAIELAPDSGFAKEIAVYEATVTGEIEPLLDPKSPLSAKLRAALLEGYRAVTSGNAGAKARAVQTLLVLPQDQQDDGVAMLLAKLGADHAAFQIAARLATNEDDAGPSIFWYRSMRGTLGDPGFPALAEQLGLMKYWRTTHARPDVCNEKTAPPFCRMI
ncbi:MAG: protein kinase [Arenimonas sp.]